MSPFNDADHTALKVPVAALRSLEPDDVTSVEHADVKFFLDYDFNRVDNKHFHHPEYYPVNGGSWQTGVSIVANADGVCPCEGEPGRLFGSVFLIIVPCRGKKRQIEVALL